MLQRDYLVQLIQQFIEAIIRSRKVSVVDPQQAADSLEAAIGNATDIDGATLLSMAPESIASVMELCGVDPRVAGYIAHSLILEADYLRQAGNSALAELRMGQGQAVALQFGIDLSEVASELDKEEVE